MTKLLFYICLMILLTPEAVQLIKDDRQLFIKIQVALAVGERTMYNYINHNTEDLTKICALNELVEHTGLPLNKLITGAKLSKLLTL